MNCNDIDSINTDCDSFFFLNFDGSVPTISQKLHQCVVDT